MAKNVLLLSLSLLGVALAGCPKKEPPSSGDSGGLMSCYIADQFRCKELPTASPGQSASLAVECSSASGVLTRGAKCPSAGFGGTCTVASEAQSKESPEVRRFYTGRDLAYEKDFCVNTAHGLWTTTF